MTDAHRRASPYVAPFAAKRDAHLFSPAGVPACADRAVAWGALNDYVSVILSKDDYGFQCSYLTSDVRVRSVRFPPHRRQ